MTGNGRHAALRTARRRGKTLLRAEGPRPVQVRDLAGSLPFEVFSRLSLCDAPLAGSLPPHVSRCRASHDRMAVVMMKLTPTPNLGQRDRVVECAVRISPYLLEF
jgi:hypothetical protein